MPLIVPDVGEVIVLKALRSATGLSNWFCMLFNNNYTPNSATVAADLVEPSFTGYAAVVVNFGVPTSVSGKGKMVGTSPINFIVSVTGSAETIYGYWVGDILTGEVVYAERFSSPQVMQNAGDTIGVTLSFTGSSEF